MDARFPLDAGKALFLIKRILDISAEPYHLSVRLEQLTLKPRRPEADTATVPCEDIGVIIIDNAEVTYTHHALASLLQAGATVVVCGANHAPAGLLVPLAQQSEVAHRALAQAMATRPVRKRLWKQIIRAKIRNQATILPDDHPARERLLAMIPQVRSGDPANLEAQAAKIYWEAWRFDEDFRRTPEGDDPVNGLLNYGYAVLRAAVARAVVAAGLNPALGLHHRHRANAFCLADDIMEPMRPWVDAVVAERLRFGATTVDRASKTELVGILHRTVRSGGQTGPLMVALHRTCASLIRCMEGQDRTLLLPRLAREDAP